MCGRELKIALSGIPTTNPTRECRFVVQLDSTNSIAMDAALTNLLDELRYGLRLQLYLFMACIVTQHRLRLVVHKIGRLQ
jgi:hypothetical protein